jgi:hypothetical protein
MFPRMICFTLERVWKPRIAIIWIMWILWIITSAITVWKSRMARQFFFKKSPQSSQTHPYFRLVENNFFFERVTHPIFLGPHLKYPLFGATPLWTR